VLKNNGLWRIAKGRFNVPEGCYFFFLALAFFAFFFPLLHPHVEHITVSFHKKAGLNLIQYISR
jgi:hypothetical protein